MVASCHANAVPIRSEKRACLQLQACLGFTWTASTLLNATSNLTTLQQRVHTAAVPVTYHRASSSLKARASSLSLLTLRPVVPTSDCLTQQTPSKMMIAPRRCAAQRCGVARAPAARCSLPSKAMGRPARLPVSTRIPLTPARAIAEPQAAETVSPEVATMCVRAIQFLAVDATNKAGSGHPGAPMGMAGVAYVLWNEYMHFNPKNPGLFNRDRFVLSNGHASMLQYSLLHLCGSEQFTVRTSLYFDPCLQLCWDIFTLSSCCRCAVIVVQSCCLYSSQRRVSSWAAVCQRRADDRGWYTLCFDDFPKCTLDL